MALSLAELDAEFGSVLVARNTMGVFNPIIGSFDHNNVANVYLEQNAVSVQKFTYDSLNVAHNDNLIVVSQQSAIGNG
jgi:hypothetical protein